MKRKLILLFPVCATLLGLSISSFAQPSPEKRPYLEYIAVPDHPDRVYATGEQASLRIEAYRGGVPLEDVVVHYSAFDEFMKPDMIDSISFEKGMAILPLGTRTEPGFRTIKFSFEFRGQKYEDYANLAFSPEQIRSFTPMPKDFKSFWKKALKEVENIDFQPVITPVKEYSTPEVEVMKVKLTVGKNGRNIFGYLSRPRDGKQHPVLFCPPGAGTRKRKPDLSYAEKGYIFFQINIHHDADSQLSDEEYKAVVDKYEDYWNIGIDDRDTYYYKDVYLACSRCIDYLCTLEDWDGKNVGVTGGSQGGALSIVTAVLNPKVDFCAAFYPALCDVNAYLYGRAPGWPKFFTKPGKGADSAPVKDTVSQEVRNAEKTLAYYDVVNFARLIKCPVFYSFGFNDKTCVPSSTCAAYNEIKAPKVLDATFTNAHWRFIESNERSMEFMAGMCE